MAHTITPPALTLFLTYARTARKIKSAPIAGTPSSLTPANWRLLTELQHARLVTTHRSDGWLWITFTHAGFRLADAYNIDLTFLDPAQRLTRIP